MEPTLIVDPPVQPVVDRRVAEFGTVAAACKDWLASHPEDGAPEREVVRQARDVAEATADLLTWTSRSSLVGRAHTTTAALDAAHVLSMLHVLLGSINVRVVAP